MGYLGHITYSGVAVLTVGPHYGTSTAWHKHDIIDSLQFTSKIRDVGPITSASER